MDQFDIVKRVRITEKGTILAHRFNQYLLEVDPRATKIDIKRAVERLFNKKVVSVNTMTVRGKLRRKRRADQGYTKSWKKAVVRLAEGESISLT